MFKCEKCGRVTNPREKCVKMPTKYRGKVYQKVVKKGYREEIITSYGKEIAKEISVCEKCVGGNKNVCTKK